MRYILYIFLNDRIKMELMGKINIIKEMEKDLL